MMASIFFISNPFVVDPMTAAVGGAALAMTARKIKEKAKVIAAHLLEAAVEDMEYEDGKCFVKGSPDKVSGGTDTDAASPKPPGSSGDPESQGDDSE